MSVASRPTLPVTLLVPPAAARRLQSSCGAVLSVCSSLPSASTQALASLAEVHSSASEFSSSSPTTQRQASGSLT